MCIYFLFHFSFLFFVLFLSFDLVNHWLIRQYHCLATELFWRFLFCKINFCDIWCLPWMSRFCCLCGVYCSIVNLCNQNVDSVECWLWMTISIFLRSLNVDVFSS